MQGKPQIFLLEGRQPGLSLVFERLEDVGYEFLDFSEALPIGKGLAVLTLGPQSKLNELEQRLEKLRKHNPEFEWIAIYTGRLKVKSQALYQLGFSEIFQIPLDEDVFTNRIFELLPINIDPKALRFDHLLRVNLPFFRDLKITPFDVFIYLPSNRRIMLYQREGQTLDSIQLEKFAKHKNHALFIRKSDIAKYKACTAASLREIRDNPELGDAAKMVLVQENMQILMSPLFGEGELDADEAKQTVRQIQEVLRGIQIGSRIPLDTVSTLEALSSQKMTNASHARNVAAYCAMFGVALGMGNTEELRLGGLLHDIGLADMPLELLGRDVKKMNEEERARYHLHPGNGRQDVVTRNLPVTESILNMILFHHELPDGSGYPYGKLAHQIPVEAQICAFADEFDKLTSFREGYRCYSARDALLLLAGRLGEPAAKVFNPAVHSKILDFYIPMPSQPREDGRSVGDGDVFVKDGFKVQAATKLEWPVALEETSDLQGSAPSVQITIDPTIAFEVLALERELEFYFLENS